MIAGEKETTALVTRTATEAAVEIELSAEQAEVRATVTDALSQQQRTL